jgi:hypothetical protein
VLAGVDEHLGEDLLRIVGRRGLHRRPGPSARGRRPPRPGF